MHPELAARAIECADPYTHLGTDVNFEDADPVAILMHSPGQELLLSVSLEETGLQRVFLGASLRQEFFCMKCNSVRCPHLERLQTWINEQEEEGLFEGFRFSGDEAGSDPASMPMQQQQHAPPCDVRINPHFSSHGVILKRCAGTLG